MHVVFRIYPVNSGCKLTRSGSIYSKLHKTLARLSWKIQSPQTRPGNISNYSKLFDLVLISLRTDLKTFKMQVSMDKINDLLTRTVDNVIPSKGALEDVLRSGKKLRVYQGFDPSTPKLHIGHMIGLRKLRNWQNLGHDVIFLIGDFTGRIGVPTGKGESRPLLSQEVIEENAKTYKAQAARILRLDGKNPIEIKFNSQWLDKMPLQDIFNLTSQLTYQQVIKRDMYQKRIRAGKDISISEVLYPIMQGY